MIPEKLLRLAIVILQRLYNAMGRPPAEVEEDMQHRAELTKLAVEAGIVQNPPMKCLSGQGLYELMASMLTQETKSWMSHWTAISTESQRAYERAAQHLKSPIHESLTTAEIKDLTAMAYGAPATRIEEEGEEHDLVALIRTYEQCIREGKRPVDPVKLRKANWRVELMSYLAAERLKADDIVAADLLNHFMKQLDEEQ